MNLDLRWLDAGCTRPPSVMPDRDPPTAAEPPGRTGPVHGIRIGDGRVTIDLWSGVGFEHNIDRGEFRRLTCAESRLMLLDWTRRHMPIPSPPVLWVIEAASLAASSEQHWREWASVDLRVALDALPHSPIEWTDHGRSLLVRARESAAVAPAKVDGNVLRSIVLEIERIVAAKWKSNIESLPAPAVVSGCSEVEWDRVLSVGVDLGEFGVRSRIFGTVWTASIAGCRPIGRADTTTRIWAQLVDEASGVVYDHVEMRCANGIYVARGYVPPAARTTATRIDLTADLTLPVRTPEERGHALSEQQYFRALYFERRAAVNPSWAQWNETHLSRLDVVTLGRGSRSSGPFLAEWHLQPTDLASGSRHLLSPGSTHTSPPAT